MTEPRGDAAPTQAEGTLPGGQYWRGWPVEDPAGVVVLVHGLHEHGGRYRHVAERLAAAGYACYAADHPGHGRSAGSRGNIGSMAGTVDGVGQAVRLAAERHPGAPLFVYGHSLGGLISRYFVQRLGGDRRVDTLVTLGTPHQGSRWAHVAPTPLIRQLRPGSPLYQELAEPVAHCGTGITAVYSDIDQVVVPTSSGRCDHPDLGARNVLVRGVGHMSLPIHRGVVDEVAATLAGVRRVSAAVIAAPAAVA